ncbi:NAD(P)H-binding protein [Kitasatospora sp. CM 4170]|uniref:SDR family oxidoreductase n=1 Tax=Kitasatospora aburaviensis TaxID=67265 RepID=A0ABW1EVV0_9ACTN|nr:NAD(P)H-binding protein [Kitasatospora sp. CM 4170]WNM49562.1 NAD(P)H-binding protein [Kitasatospora sp. CM 4170]
MIVVTGATGNVGRPLVQALAAAGEQVTAVSRRPSDASLPVGVRHHRADLTDAGSLRPALDGAEALFLLLSGEVLAGADGRSAHALLDAAKAAGVRRVVLLSSQVSGTRPGSVSHAPLVAYEEAVRESGLDWTILRPSGFHSNAFAWAEPVRTRRTVPAPFGDVALPTVDPEDLAAVAATVLRDGRAHAGRTYVLTGPAPVSPREQADALGAALGEPVHFVELGREAARAHLLQFMPEPVAEGTLDVLGEPTDEERLVGPDVEQLLGRPAGTFADWARRNAPAFR